MAARSPRECAERAQRLRRGLRLAERDLRFLLQQETTPNGQPHDTGLRELRNLYRSSEGGGEPQVCIRSREQGSEAGASCQRQEWLQCFADRRRQLPIAIDRNQEIAQERGFH